MGFVKYLDSDGNWKKLLVPDDMSTDIETTIARLEEKATDIERQLGEIESYISNYRVGESI